jgi:hypothetical protein
MFGLMIGAVYHVGMLAEELDDTDDGQPLEPTEHDKLLRDAKHLASELAQQLVIHSSQQPVEAKVSSWDRDDTKVKGKRLLWEVPTLSGRQLWIGDDGVLYRRFPPGPRRARTEWRRAEIERRSVKGLNTLLNNLTEALGAEITRNHTVS